MKRRGRNNTDTGPNARPDASPQGSGLGQAMGAGSPNSQGGPITDKAQAWVQARAAIKEAAATAAEAGRAAGAVAEVINERSTIYPRKYGGIPCQD
jgi:hypothetical protein